ncbi:MAG: hypothetical protein HY728_04475 [Candidatus Rokubacteria bacterium]|nr:hypothetical protein [Candidatus Rokubacteria bacterium]
MRIAIVTIAVLASLAGASAAAAQEVRELLGSWVIDGYSFKPGDRSPRGTIAYDADANTLKGTYVGLRLPADRPELHAWLYNTQTKKALHVGKLAYKAATVGKAKGGITLALPPQFKGGKFQGYELIAFSAESAGAAPKAPSGSTIQAEQKPAFYLYAPLPGASVPGIYCGHGQDFSFTSNQDHTCFD